MCTPTLQLILPLLCSMTIFLVGMHSASSLNGKQLGPDDLERVHETVEEFIQKRG